MKKLKTVAVSPRALIQRINRVIVKYGERLKATRGDKLRNDLGDYYIVKNDRNKIKRTDVDLEALGRECGALKRFEHLQNE